MIIDNYKYINNNVKIVIIITSDDYPSISFNYFIY